ncbi:type VII secretion protein EccE [Nocardia sp. CA-107356]|uniref:type VII secretion protein EccE n=1 Tax=Nocardia sp. CA-107356 TaxID=3239972 RepID=UPI003D94CC5E
MNNQNPSVERTVPVRSATAKTTSPPREPGPSRGFSDRHRAEPPHGAELRSEDLWLFRTFPLRLVFPVAVLAVIGSLIPAAVHTPWWACLAVGAPIALIGLTPIHGMAIGTHLANSIAFRWRTGSSQGIEQESTFDLLLPEGGNCGLRWDGTRLTTMLRIDPPPDTLTMLRRGSLSTDQVVPLTDIARCLHQFDIALDSVDVISTGTRTCSNEAVLSGYAASVAPLARMYDEILGPLPAIAHRTVWIVLRLDPLGNAEAVDNRGGGSQGALRTAIIATRRVANRLAARGITASVLTAAEMTGAVRELTRGIPIDQFNETPHSLQHNDIHLTSYRIGTELINGDGFARVWAAPSMATTVTIRLRSAIGDTRRRNAQTPIELDALVRYDTTVAPDSPPAAGLRAIPGRQLWALLDSLPISTRDVQTTGYHGPLAALTGINVPTAGCGQLIGADDTGSGIAVPLVGDGTRRIDIVGSLHLAQQVILRAIALGANAVVHTSRPWAWQTMIQNVAAPHALSLTARTSTGRHATMTQDVPHAAATLLVFDGVPSTPPPGSATVVNIFDALAGPLPVSAGADVTIVQHTSSAYGVTVHTPAAMTIARLVTTPTEQHYIGGAFASA